jgi:hypothetical protein
VAAEAGDFELARSIELRVQEVLKRLHPLPQSSSFGVRVKLGGGGECPPSFDPDVLIDTCRILATAADYELEGAIYAAGHRQEDNWSHIYQSRDHGESWRFLGGFASTPPEPQEKIGLVVGEGDSTFVYGFFIHPADNGDLWCARFDTSATTAWVFPVLVGPDTVTDFAVCRDYSGGNYWLYAVTANEQGHPDSLNDLVLRSVDYGKTWAVVDTLVWINDPHITASGNTWMFVSSWFGPEHPGHAALWANAYYMSPDSMYWHTQFFVDTSDILDPVVATSFEADPDSATLWILWAHRRRNTRNWDIMYFWSNFYANWSDSLTLAGHPDYDERFPDIRSYTFRGSPWINACYITEGPQFRAVQRRHANSGSPTSWSTPLTLNETSAGTGSGVRPKLCYTPGGPGTGAGAVFTGAGLMGLYWNAPWRTGVVEEGPKDQVRRTGQTICHGTLIVGTGHDRNPPGGFGSCLKPMLLDISGRKVMDLVFGENDVSQVAPGVYFCRPAVGSRGDMRRVVIQ